MRNTALRERLMKEDKWFVDLVNSRSRLADADRKAGKKFTTLAELQTEYD